MCTEGIRGPYEEEGNVRLTVEVNCAGTNGRGSRMDERRGRNRESRGRSSVRGTKPVLPRRGESHALSAVRGRNEERVAVLARRQERQEVAG